MMACPWPVAAQLPAVRTGLRRSRAGLRNFPSVRQSSTGTLSSGAGDAARLAIEGVHSLTGLPWWATLLSCGVGLRLILLPLSRVQATHVMRMRPVLPILRDYLAGKSEDGLRPVRDGLHKSRCSLSMIVGPPLMSITGFISATWGVRTLAVDSTGHVRDSLASGGALWFTDLTVADTYAALPLLHIILVLFNLELGLGSLSTPSPPQMGSAGVAIAAPSDAMRRVFGGLHTGMNMTMLTFFPLLCELPQAVFVFWIASSSSSLAYQSLLKPYTASSMTQPAAAAIATTTAAPATTTTASVASSTTKMPDALAADMRHVKHILSSSTWAVPATPALRDRLQKLLDGERKRGKITTKFVAVLEADGLDSRKTSIGIRNAQAP